MKGGYNMTAKKEKNYTQKVVESALSLAGMTQTQLAEKMGTSVSALNQKLARGKLTMEDYKKIGEITGLRFVCRYEQDYL